MAMLKRFCFDVETHPTRNQSVIDEIVFEEGKKECPGKPESANPRQTTLDRYVLAVEEWQAGFQSRCVEKVLATAKNPLLAEPLCVSAVCDGDLTHWTAMHGMSEEDMLRQLMGFIEDTCDRSTEFSGYCIKIFDLPVILTRCRVYGIEIPSVFPSFNRYWSDNVVDIQDLIYSPRPCLSFANAAICHGLKVKDSVLWKGEPVNGSMIKDIWDAGDYDTILDYCDSDAMDEWKLLCICKPSVTSNQGSFRDQVAEVVHSDISAELKVLTLENLVRM